ncbi:MAG: hypothetical protein JW719_05005 [Pirellulales bacterium]|nr:hypothetical protein [Pirellulales bacterium]
MSPSSFPNDANPFSTRCVRPGAIPFFFPPDVDASILVRRLADNQWRGQIVGPHGSGKSTLLAALFPAIEASSKHVVLVELHDGQRRLPVDVNVGRVAIRRDASPSPGHDSAYQHADHSKKSGGPAGTVEPAGGGTPILVIDGYEQLPWWRRWSVQRRCRRCGVGLLVTSHRSVGLPDLFHTQVDARLARRVVDALLAGRPDTIPDNEIDDCVRRHGQDLREALFDLYDVYEQHRR